MLHGKHHAARLSAGRINGGRQIAIGNRRGGHVHRLAAQLLGQAPGQQDSNRNPRQHTQHRHTDQQKANVCIYLVGLGTQLGGIVFLTCHQLRHHVVGLVGDGAQLREHHLGGIAFIAQPLRLQLVQQRLRHRIKGLYGFEGFIHLRFAGSGHKQFFCLLQLRIHLPHTFLIDLEAVISLICRVRQNGIAGGTTGRHQLHIRFGDMTEPHHLVVIHGRRHLTDLCRLQNPQRANHSPDCSHHQKAADELDAHPQVCKPTHFSS